MRPILPLLEIDGVGLDAVELLEQRQQLLFQPLGDGVHVEDGAQRLFGLARQRVQRTGVVGQVAHQLVDARRTRVVVAHVEVRQPAPALRRDFHELRYLQRQQQFC